MQVCKDHWQLMRDAIDAAGLSSLVAKDGETAAQNIKEELEGGKAPFDPLMSMNWHWHGCVLEQGGLTMLMPNDDGTERCPVCEYVKNVKGFDAKAEIENVAQQIRTWCVSEKLIGVN